MSTITDVAREVGVSVATVSRALRGLDRVNPDTRARVFAAAQRLNYVASPTARSLASGRTHVIGVIAPYVTRWYFAQTLSGIGKGLREHGYQLLVFDLEDASLFGRIRLEQSMLFKRVDGLISLNVPFDDDERALIDSLSTPFLAVGAHLEGKSVIDIDDAAAMTTLTNHVLDLGHTKIGFVGAVPDDSALIQTPTRRRKAVLDTCAARGIDVPPERIVISDWTAASAHEPTRALLRSRFRPTVIIAGSDEIAFGVMAAAWSLGLRVPQDLSVVGMDDHDLAATFDLTTVRQDVADQGRQAAELILRHVHDPDLAPQQVLCPTELIVRGSCGPP